MYYTTYYNVNIIHFFFQVFNFIQRTFGLNCYVKLTFHHQNCREMNPAGVYVKAHHRRFPQAGRCGFLTARNLCENLYEGIWHKAGSVRKPNLPVLGRMLN